MSPTFRTNVSDYSVRLETAIIDLIKKIDETGVGCALVVDGSNNLISIVTDGDIRRAVIMNVDMTKTVNELLDLKGAASVVALPSDANRDQIIGAMIQYHLRQIPLVDPHGKIVGLSLFEEIAGTSDIDITAIVMAGGFGRRLYPLTQNTPKPMLTVGTRPLLEHTISRLRDSGVKAVNITVHFKKEVIVNHFGNGSGFGVDIEYFEENKPLGTAGSISLIPHRGRTVLVMNGDVLTTVNFKEMLDYHRRHEAVLTMAVASHEVTVPYGVVLMDDVCVKGIVEKPKTKHFINTGIYLIEPEACELIPRDTVFDMPDLINRILAIGGKVIGFPIREYWKDVGQPADFEQANKDIVKKNLDG